MNLLAVDTSAEGCSAAVLSQGQVHSRFTLAPRGHTRLLMPMVRELLAECGLAPYNLDAVAFACGPGSFTGLRIATGVAQGLAYGLNVPVIPISSLATVAAQMIESEDIPVGDGIAVAFDARMGEVYWGCFANTDGTPSLIDKERVCLPENVSLPTGLNAWSGAGSGWALQEQMPAAVTSHIIRLDTAMVPHAANVVRLAEQAWHRGLHVPAAAARPMYLRDEVTWKKLPGR